MLIWYLTVNIRPGHEAQKSLLQGLHFFCIFEKSGKNEATDLAVSQLPPAQPGAPKSHCISTQPRGDSTLH